MGKGKEGRERGKERDRETERQRDRGRIRVIEGREKNRIVINK